MNIIDFLKENPHEIENYIEYIFRGIRARAKSAHEKGISLEQYEKEIDDDARIFFTKYYQQEQNERTTKKNIYIGR